MQADEMAGQTFPQFVAICYRQQVVAGMNYRIKVGPVTPHRTVYKVIDISLLDGRTSSFETVIILDTLGQQATYFKSTNASPLLSQTLLNLACHGLF